MMPILLADPQAIFRAGMARVLGTQADMSILGQSEGTEELIVLLKECRNGILLAAASVIRNFDAFATQLRANNVRLVVLVEGDDALPPAWMRRVDGLLFRHASADDLLHCLRRVAAGERFLQTPGGAQDATGRRIRDSLTARELQIVGYIVHGWKNRQIADEMGTKEQVVKNYLRSIYDKTGASDRLELALFTLHHRVLADAAAKTVGPAATAAR